MIMAQLPNPFLSSASHVPVDVVPAAASPCPPSTAAAVPIADIDCINEIFFYARKLVKQPPRFVLDESRFLAEVEEVPLFLREDGYLQRREA